jgi:ABC-2 type transport system permease protein
MRTPAAPAAVNQAALFSWLRWRVLRNFFRTLLGSAFVRLLTIMLVSVTVCAFVYVISHLGFQFLAETVHLPVTGEIIGRVIDLMFLALGSLLIFSSGLILYGSLFTSAETAFLLSKPAAADQVFAYKFQGAVGFSSWAFLLLGGPVLIAFGVVGQAPWYFYVFLPLFFLGFILLPGSVGAVLCLLVVNYVPRRRKQVLLVVVVLVLAGLGWWVYHLVQAARPAAGGGREAVTRLLEQFDFARGGLLPSHWVSLGLRKAASRQPVGPWLSALAGWARGGFRDEMPDHPLRAAAWYLALVWSNGLMAYLLASWLAARLYRRGFNRLSTGGSIQRRVGGLWLDNALSAALVLVPPRTRLLIVKDFRTFRRDPQQWGQVVLFTGLLLLYITNIRRLFAEDMGWMYQNTISLLNLCAVSLLLCTYTGRFIYPLLSLEGRKFWVLGLLPLERDQLLWGKFAFSAAGCFFLATPLVLLSDLMLEMPWEAALLHGLTVVVLAAGLSGLSVGLGAAMPNFRESDPSKIAVGFGGTLNLVACLGLLVLTLCLLALPWHIRMAGAQGPPVQAASWWLVGPPAAAGVALGALAVLLPLRLGIRRLRAMEF